MKKIVWLVREYENNYGGTEYSPAINFWFGTLERLGYEVKYYPYENYEAETFYQKMKEYKPDYIIHACYEQIHTEFVKLREFTKVLIIQSDDDWRYSTYARFWIPFVDNVITLQGDKNAEPGTRCRDLIGWYLQDGLTSDQIHTVRCAFNPNTMLADHLLPKDITVSHGGSLYGERETLLQQFKHLGVDVSIVNKVFYAQLVELWNRSKFSLSFTKASDGQFRQKKGRIGEIGYYSVVVSEPFPNIEEYYEDGKEFILFNSVEEAVDKVRYYSNNEKEYLKLLSNSRNRLWNTNTSLHQWDTLMSKIDPDYVKKDVAKLLSEYKQPI